MDWKLELVAVPVSDVDRAKAFYQKRPAEYPWLSPWGCKPGGPPGRTGHDTYRQIAGFSPIRQNG